MARKRDKSEKIVAAALKLAAAQGWTGLTQDDIAASAGVSLPDLARVFPDKASILAHLARTIDAEVLEAAAGEEITDESARDRLFDVLMLRFDALAPYKPALKRIAADLVRDPFSALPLLRPGVQSMNWMLEAAGIDTAGLGGALRVRGLALVWAAAFRVWLGDGEDQARTMAELDRRLRQGENLLAALNQLSRRESGSAA